LPDWHAIGRVSARDSDARSTCKGEEKLGRVRHMELGDPGVG
jgi:hypothetical protein